MKQKSSFDKGGEELSQNSFFIASTIGIALTFFIGVINFFLSLQRLRLETITKNRMEWINNLRMLLSEIIVLTNIEILKGTFNNQVKFEGILTTLGQKTALLKLHLNFKGIFDKRVINVAEKIRDNLESISYFLQLKTRYKGQQAIMPPSFKSYISNHSSEKFLHYLLMFAAKDNPDSEFNLIITDNMPLEELKKLAINEYCCVRNSKCYLDKFIREHNFYDEMVTEVNSLKQELVKLSQIYLKSEWTRIKYEARIFKLRKYNEYKEMCRLEKFYGNEN